MTPSVSPYHALRQRIAALCDGETDTVALMATIACELYHAFDHFDWVGFYRHVGDGALKIGPYQGGHGCLTIPSGRGVCGKCAREQQIQNVPDVNAVPDHIACSSTTRSELVLPVVSADGELIAVLDIDSDTPHAFTVDDERHLQAICAIVAGP
ncbi:MAG: GAF domain-containing protein [Verrucomicrobia bacterium]|mgnify:CR=1|jgi:L-methionine (R)-S-oxide reductase|nr:GAF domain-containing protein [Verrucomicrobiota bacterium]MBT7066460.1 GAF domain-containing protein [Verrucomicrobiota bacterium]MBT7701723.1 GAF domain-containing protein [Verrucomicrobiota bacterium]